MDRFPITRAGYNRLRIELQRLQQDERPRVIEAIAEARAHGDITENAEYDAAKEKQALVEGKINDLHHKLSQCEVVEVPVGPAERVIFGTTVEIEDLDTGELKKKEVELLVLATGIVPNSRNKKIAKILKLKIDHLGFFKEKDPLTSPLETNVEGIYLCGGATGPIDIAESVVQAMAAALKAILNNESR